ncbi:MAG: type II toxin-antitoxin system VapC family toxin [Selenomonadaceae bacterium]|nr:type II toxin-antitoxin system VapC family toxin [Selenomonadaceae bacterium]
MYLLDTNICIYAIKGTYPELTKKLLSIPPSEIFISSITVSELEYGAAKSQWGERTRIIMQSFLANFEILPFDENDAICLGRFRASLARAGTPIGAYDVMIAAQGFARGLTVVTHNVREFSRIPGLLVEDWALDSNQ